MGRPKGSKNKISKMIEIVCKFCSKKFKTYPCRIKNNPQYCSRTCYGKEHIFKPNKGSFKKGFHYSPKTEFKKGHPAPETAFKKGIKGKNHPQWKGGEINNNGYIMVLSPEHPFCDRQGRVRRSHLIMEQHLGRYLKPKEVVHHINGI